MTTEKQNNYKGTESVHKMTTKETHNEYEVTQNNYNLIQNDQRETKPI